MNFFISIVVFSVATFLMILSIRYGLLGMRRVDAYFSSKNKSSYPGFELYYRIPFSIGTIPEYFFAIILKPDNYYRKDWWALKTASFISLLVFIAGLKSRSAVYSYFSFDFISEHGISALFSSGIFVWYLNIVLILFVALFVLICYESIKMHGFYAPVRILAFTLMSSFMATLTVITLSTIILIVVVYFAFKIIGFFLFSNKDKKKEKDDDESATSILSGGFRVFKADLYEWEVEEKNSTSFTKDRDEQTEPKIRRKPKITRRKRKVTVEDDIPRLRPD